MKLLMVVQDYARPHPSFNLLEDKDFQSRKVECANKKITTENGSWIIRYKNHILTH